VFHNKQTNLSSKAGDLTSITRWLNSRTCRTLSKIDISQNNLYK